MNIRFDDSRDNGLCVWQALQAMKDGETLFLGGGVHHFWPDTAGAAFYCVSNNHSGWKYTAFLLQNRHNITIDGQGAELIFHGEVCPFILDGCDGVTLRDLTIDWARPYDSQARILRVEQDYIDLRFDPEFPVRIVNGGFDFYSREDGWSTGRMDRFLVTEFDAETRSPSAYKPPYLPDFSVQYASDYLTGKAPRYYAQQLADGTVRFHGVGQREHTAGNWWVATHAMRYCSGVLVHLSCNVLLENITMYHTPSMGVIGQFSENLTLRRIRMVPRPGSGRLLSVAADATHFVHCTGLLELDGCEFTHMLDDACNVHGDYTVVKRRLDERTLLVCVGHALHAGLPLYSAGDSVEFVDPNSMLTLAKGLVDSADAVNPQCALLRFAEVLPPEAAEGVSVGCYDKMPEVYVHDCVTGWNRPRGLLIGTGKRVRIEGNRFTNMSHAVHITGDAADWFESGPVGDVLIRNNDFDNSAYTGDPVIAVDPHITKHAGAYHRNIRITDNRFRLADPRFLYASDTEGLVMRDNTFVRDLTLPRHPTTGENGVQLRFCTDCDVQLPEKK